MHSNVARLHNAFPDNGTDGLSKKTAWSNPGKYYNFYRTYVPGVGTPFDEVGDTGEGSMRTQGLAFAYMGENRIIWALVEMINNVHRYYRKQKLIDTDKFKASFNKLTLPDFGETHRFAPSFNEWNEQATPCQRMTALFTAVLKDLHMALQMYVPVDEAGKSKDHGKVINIFLSVFGFSRGAAEARAFANWLTWLCKLDAEISGRAGLSLGTIPVTFDFMGLFDTVASVGLASSAPVPGSHGHYGWADSEYSLKICDPAPAQCLHLVSAHEVRRSFPLDSVMYEGTLQPNCTEIVFPGVHSDVGGGYKPREQGRGKDEEGADMLSRITLATMYRAARLAGVQLKLEEAPESVRRSFRVDPGLIQMFNAYIASCTPVTEKDAPVSMPLHVLMAQQHRLYIQWRKKMLGRMASLKSVQDSDGPDREDITAADRELVDEVARFDAWRDRNPYQDSGSQPYSWSEWESVAAFWDAPAPPASVTDLFDQYVHDSRAWFKPFGKDASEVLFQMEELATRKEARIEWKKNPVGKEPPPLSNAEERRVAKYLPYRGQSNAMDGIDFESRGREGELLGGGFLRYRKIYMGSDRYKPSGAVYAGLRPVEGIGGRRLAANGARETKSAVSETV
ncbi:T6SS phospholipase effector Tle1-like catalytic domain-containing protein [Noviherbaspirillum cavernae]|uniref:T6SS phospholipase effector Tle1-like catalytic domain-containing protein n=1 Tax=Noviherbaspirillum cavernae TaxID=2320862 RepID=UPI001F5B57F5|nr:DUF2235 domain-containing protein [Noviherbaspirillum cavernae]